MKKLVLGILILGALTGCSFDEEKNNSKETIDYTSFIKGSATYLETKESTVTLDGKSHKLSYIYSWENTEDDQCSGYMTVLFDGKLLSSELTNYVVSSLSGETNICKETRSDIVEKVIDTDKDTLALVITGGAFETSSNASVGVISSEGKVLMFSDEYANFGVQYKSNNKNYLTYDETLKTEYIKINDNLITVYTCKGIKKYTINGYEVEKNTSDYPTGTYLSGGC